MTPLLYWTLLLFTCALVFLRGRRDEQIAALVAFGGSVVTLLTHTIVDVRYVDVEQGDLLIDLAVLIAFVGLALYSDRFWPLWVAGFQLTSSLAHFLKAVEPGLIPQAYAAAARIWSYPILIIILIGAWRSHRRTKAERMAGTA